jgi:hypothetical protein
MEGIWRYIKLILDPASKKNFEEEAQDALDKGTDPKKAEGNLDKVDSKFKALSFTAKRLGVVLAGLFAAGKIVKETVDSERELAQLNATIRSTGGAAGFSAQQLVGMADALSRASVFGGGQIITAQTRLLTYTNIQGESFERATQAALDMATALRIDVASAAETVGRALGDPIAATGALSRQGFKFTQEQKDMMEAMIRVGDVAGAQAIIMEELELAYGGSAEAARDTLGGALAALRKEFNSLLSDFGSGTASNLNLTYWVNWLTDRLTQLRQAIEGTADRTRILANEAMIFSAQIGQIFSMMGESFGWTSGNMARRLEGTIQNLRQEIEMIELNQRTGALRRLTASSIHASDRPAATANVPPPADTTAEVDKQRRAVEALIASLQKERDALIYSEQELLKRSEAFRNATAAEQQMMLTLQAEADGIRRYTQQLEAANREKERLDGLTRNLVDSLQDELDALTLSEAQILRNSEAYRNASLEQQMQISAIEGLIDAERALEAARREQIATQYQIQREMEDTAENMTRAFQPFFYSMAEGFGNSQQLLAGFRESAAGIGAAVVGELTKGKAEYHFAEGLGSLASGTWPPNAAALAASAKHFAAAAAFRSIPGIIYGIGRGGGVTAGRSTMTRGAEPNRLMQQPPEINIYIDPLNPSNPAYQSNLAQTLTFVNQRYGSNANVTVRPRT